MKLRAHLQINEMADEAGASGWRLVRQNKHLIIDFQFPGGAVRQVISATGSDWRMNRNMSAQLRRSTRG